MREDGSLPAAPGRFGVVQGSGVELGWEWFVWEIMRERGGKDPNFGKMRL